MLTPPHLAINSLVYKADYVALRHRDANNCRPTRCATLHDYHNQLPSYVSQYANFLN